MLSSLHKLAALFASEKNTMIAQHLALLLAVLVAIVSFVDAIAG
jgi:hypothetical protein